jgi:hypothetical protein
MGPPASEFQRKPNIAGVIDEKPFSMMCNAKQSGQLFRIGWFYLRSDQER